MDFFAAGGSFMPILAILGLGVLLLTSKKVYDVFFGPARPADSHERGIQLILHLGVFAFFLGILSQTTGLLMALQAIERIQGVSPAMVAGGLKVSLIAPIFGLLILIVAFVAWAVLKYATTSLRAEAA